MKTVLLVIGSALLTAIPSDSSVVGDHRNAATLTLSQSLLPKLVSPNNPLVVEYAEVRLRSPMLQQGTLGLVLNSPPKPEKAKSLGAQLPRPGVYESTPFSCVVVVPSPHPDDRALMRPLEEPSILTVKPQLKLVPCPVK